MPPRTAGWTRSPTGGEPRAFQPSRSGGHCGPTSAVPPQSEPRSAKTRLEEGGEGTAFAHWRDTAITADEGDYAFQALLRHDRAYTGYAPMIPSPWLTAFAQRSPLAQMFQSTGLNRSGTSRFLAELSELPIEEWPTRIRRLVAEQVGLILRRTIDIDRPLTEYGLDSLSSQELRAHMEAETGIRITATDINSTVRGLADLLYAKLAPDAGAPAPSQNE